MRASRVLVGALALASCAGGEAVVTPDTSRPELAPSVTSISPATYTTTTSLQTMTVGGSGFAADATLSFVSPDGATMPSTPSRLLHISSSQLQYKFNSGGEAGTWTVVVVTLDGRLSNPQVFEVRP